MRNYPSLNPKMVVFFEFTDKIIIFSLYYRYEMSFVRDSFIKALYCPRQGAHTQTIYVHCQSQNTQLPNRICNGHMFLLVLYIQPPMSFPEPNYGNKAQAKLFQCNPSLTRTSRGWSLSRPSFPLFVVQQGGLRYISYNLSKPFLRESPSD